MMLLRGLLLALIVASAGCAYLEGPRWALLSDTAHEAFFIDRQEIKRLDNGNYLCPVKTCLYLEGQTHKVDATRDTDRLQYIEIDCQNRRWQDKGRSVVDKHNRTLFQHLNSATVSQAVEPETLQQVAYNYLCSDLSITPLHNH